MFPAWVRTSSASLASLMPPALPRPLDDDGVARLVGFYHRLVDGVGGAPGGHRDAEPGEVLLALVLE
jgi:hypothetical protein